jgi:hypothetical protein
MPGSYSWKEFTYMFSFAFSGNWRYEPVALTTINPVVCIYVFFMFLNINWLFPLNSICQFIIVMVKCYVFFEVWSEFLNDIWTSFQL